MSDFSFRDLVHQGPAHDKFMSRFFALFSEQIVRLWCESEWAPYEDLGRPTLWAPGDKRGRTLDFLLKRRADGKVFVAEQKSLIEYEGYRWLQFDSACIARIGPPPDPRREMFGGEGFRRFLTLARDPSAYTVRYFEANKRREIAADGCILIWGSVDDGAREAARSTWGIEDVLSLETIIADLAARQDPAYLRFLGEREAWVLRFFGALRG